MSDESSKHELVQLAFCHGVSTRLKNSLLAAQNVGALEGLSIAAIASNDPIAIDRLMRIPNLGRGGIAELRTITIAENAQDNSFTREISNTLPTQIAHRPAFGKERAIANAEEAVNYLDERAREILCARLGLGGVELQSLNTLGENLGLTRERVRQIEARALTQLSTMFGQTFSQMRLLQQSAYLAQISTYYLIKNIDEVSLFNSLSSDMRLLVAVEFKNARTWLDTVCHKIPGGWILPGLTPELFEQTQEWLSDRLVMCKLPCPVSDLLTPDAPTEVAINAALHLSTEIKVVDGYLLPKRSTRRPRRAARIHNLMRRQNLAQPISLFDLKETYHCAHSDDKCSARDLLVVLLDYVHLFLNQYEAGWLPLGPLLTGSPHLPYRHAIHTNEILDDIKVDEDEPPDANDTATLRGTLAQILLECGPQSFNDLRRLFVLKVGKRYSKASVGPVLISTDEFIRIGPGIYAHRSQFRDKFLLAEASDRLLLNKAQCEIFCRALWAGESATTYALWTPNMQMRWAEWCHNTNQKELLASLLAVCSIETWPMKSGDRLRWEKLQDMVSMYLLEEPSLHLTDRLPTFRDFLSAASLAVNTGHVSWMGINRVTGYRVDDRHAVSSLALLIAAEIIEPAMHWQQQHQTTKKSRDVLHPLLSQSQLACTPQWTQEVINSFRRSHDGLLEPGWMFVCLLN